MGPCGSGRTLIVIVKTICNAHKVLLSLCHGAQRGKEGRGNGGREGQEYPIFANTSVELAVNVATHCLRIYLSLSLVASNLFVCCRNTRCRVFFVALPKIHEV